MQHRGTVFAVSRKDDSTTAVFSSSKSPVGSSKQENRTAFISARHTNCHSAQLAAGKLVGHDSRSRTRYRRSQATHQRVFLIIASACRTSSEGRRTFSKTVRCRELPLLGTTPKCRFLKADSSWSGIAPAIIAPHKTFPSVGAANAEQVQQGRFAAARPAVSRTVSFPASMQGRYSTA